MIELLDDLQTKADNFKSEEGQVLAIFVFVISLAIFPYFTEEQICLNNREYELEEGHSPCARYTLTTNGEVICLTEYFC